MGQTVAGRKSQALRLGLAGNLQPSLPPLSTPFWYAPICQTVPFFPLPIADPLVFAGIGPILILGTGLLPSLVVNMYTVVN